METGGIDKKTAVAAVAVLMLIVLGYAILSGRLMPPPSGYICADGSQAASISDCPEYTKYICPDGTIVNNAEDCLDACNMDSVKASLRAKSHPDDEGLHAVASLALTAFNASGDDEALFYREQLDKNLRARVINDADYYGVRIAMALHRFVRDNVTLSQAPVDFTTTRDDLTVLDSRTGRRDEKALLYRSMLTANGIGSKLVVFTNCGEPGACTCIYSPPKVFVAIDVPSYNRMQFYTSPYYPGSPVVCALSNGMVVVDASTGYFGYGLNCSGKSFFTVMD